MPDSEKHNSQDQWERLNSAFDEIYALSAEDRVLALERLSVEEPAVIDELRSMLKASERAKQERFLDAGLLPRETDLFADREEPSIEAIGNYKILKEIGRGGMGLVYLGEHRELKRKVAIKVIKRGMDSDEILRRFRLERHLLATLDHPNIAKLLDGGTTEDGRPYFVLEFVDGLPVTEFCDRNKLRIENRLLVFQKICSAVAYAHRHLVVHRDIKPSNIIVDSSGEPKLLDFGISKLLDPAGSGVSIADTALGMRLLTPEYASPEQLQGGTVSTASDIYSLGVVLYELMTGQRPVQLEGKPIIEFSKLVMATDPRAPSTVIAKPITDLRKGATGGQISPDTLAEHRGDRPDKLIRRLRGDLDKIVLMALRKEPDDRYLAAEQLSEDIDRHLSGLPVMARPASIGYLAAKFARRHRPQVAAAAAALLAIVTGFGVAIWQAKVATDERNRAEARFEEVRKLSNLLVSGWDEGLGETAVSHEARARLAGLSARFLDSLSAEANDPALLKELAEAHIKLGHEFAYQLIDTKSAEESISKAESIARRLVADAPQENTYKDVLARALFKKDEFFGHLNMNDSLANRTERLQLREAIFTLEPNSESATRGYGMALADVANGYLELGDVTSSNEYFRRSIDAYRQRIELLSTLSDSPDRDRKIAGSYAVITDHFASRLGDIASAYEAAAEGYAAGKRAYEGNAEEHDNIVVRLMTGFLFGQVLQNMGRLSEAERMFSEIAVVAKLRNDQKPTSYFARKEYDAYLELAEIAFLSNERTKAFELVQASDEVRRRWESGDSHRSRSRSTYGGAVHLTVSGKLLVTMGAVKEGRERLLAAAQIFDEITQREPQNNLRSANLLASLYVTLGDVESGIGVCGPTERPFGGVSEQAGYCLPGSVSRPRVKMATGSGGTAHYRKAEQLYSKLERENMLTRREVGELELVRSRLLSNGSLLARQALNAN
ncbi:serine/threonine protein kinase [Leptolyngbya sp. 7M]|uniref:serine/threonine protein kinase n=1 Tax=Leptolyngbya sp. 7M TaxID=2812896 RepID=UPI001B8D7BA7|nr:serine/threonine-protein kinase [Leptolyngbya sp. 7M]